MIFSLVLVLVPVYSGSKSYVYIKIDTSGFRSQEFSSSLQSYHAVSGPSKHIKYWQVSDTAYQIISGMFLFIKLIFFWQKNSILGIGLRFDCFGKLLPELFSHP